MRKSASGEIDFSDYVQLTRMMTASASQGKDPDVDVAVVAKKLEEYKAILDAMTPLERSKPERLLENAMRVDFIERIAKESKTTEKSVHTFLAEFKTTRAMFVKLASGKKWKQVQRELSDEVLEEKMVGKPRSQRRGVGGKRRKQPEWMNP